VTDTNTDNTSINAAAPAMDGCTCCDSTKAAVTTGSDSEETTGMTTTTYTVIGMTCGHCVNAVSIEIGTVAGVNGVEVDLTTGAVHVTSAAPLDRADVASAVDEAGYTLAEGDVEAGTGRTG